MGCEPLSAVAARTLESCRGKNLRLATAESCTGGLIAAALTDIPGASDVFDRGFVTYSNEAKRELLSVPGSLLDAHGAVSEPVAGAMAEGALKYSRAELAVSVTGIAGPGGGSTEKPVGLVFLAVASRGGETACEKHVFDGGRAEIRIQAAARALQMLYERAQSY